MRLTRRPGFTVWLVISGVTFCSLLVIAGLIWRTALTSGEAVNIGLAFDGKSGPILTLHHPFIELAKLVVAFLIGVLMTEMHRVFRREKRVSSSMLQAQILLCVAGALVMIIIGDSLARAFGIAGAASMIRFRTPVEDPKDALILFLLLALGMACGLGAFAVAGLGAAFLGAVIVILDAISMQVQRTMLVTVSAAGPEFPTAFVTSVFNEYGLQYEPRDVKLGDRAEVRYVVQLDGASDVDEISQRLKCPPGGGIAAVCWEKRKKADK